MPQSYAASQPTYVLAPSEASLADVGRAVARHWQWVAIPTAIAFLASLAFVMLVTPRYTGEARLLLQTSDTYFTRPGNDRFEQQPQIDEQAVASQVQVVMSRDLAREAIKRLGLVGNSEFDPEVGGLGILQSVGVMLGLIQDPKDRAPEDRVLENYYKNLLVYPVGKSRIVAIEFRSRDPELAAKGANTIAALYLELNEAAKQKQAKSASAWLGTNIEDLRKRVAEAEAKVEAFRARTGLLVGTGSTTISAQQLSELSSQLAQARSQRSDAEAKAKLIREAIRDGRAFEIPDVANNELIRRLTEQRISLRAQLALEQRSLLGQHPRIKELNAQLADLEGQLRAAGDRIVRTLENDARIAGARVEALEAAIEAQKKVVAAANENEVQLRALEREAKAQREQLETYLARYREAVARDTDSGAAPEARIVSHAIVPQVPSFPKKLPIIGLSTLAALVLSVGTIVARELLGSRPVAAATILPYAPGQPARGAYPYPDPARREFEFELDRSGYGPVIDDEPAPVVVTPVAGQPERPDERHDFGDLIARLSRTEVEGRGRRVLVANVESRQRALGVARGIAEPVSRNADVILVHVDADEGQPVDESPGLTDLVAGEATFADVIRGEPGARLQQVLPGTLLNEALTGSPEGLDVALEAFERTYEWVIIVLVGPQEEGLLSLLAARVDSVVLASDLGASDPELVSAYQATLAAGATDVVVAREQPVLREAA